MAIGILLVEHNDSIKELVSSAPGFAGFELIQAFNEQVALSRQIVLVQPPLEKIHQLTAIGKAGTMIGYFPFRHPRWGRSFITDDDDRHGVGIGLPNILNIRLQGSQRSPHQDQIGSTLAEHTVF